MWIKKKKLLKMLTEATEKGIDMGMNIKQGGIYEGQPRIIREAQKILNGMGTKDE